MKRYDELPANTDLYARIKAAPMNAHEREIALVALRNADAIVDAILWVSDRLKRLSAKIFAKPASLKHSH